MLAHILKLNACCVLGTVKTARPVVSFNGKRQFWNTGIKLPFIINGASQEVDWDTDYDATCISECCRIIPGRCGREGRQQEWAEAEVKLWCIQHQGWSQPAVGSSAEEMILHLICGDRAWPRSVDTGCPVRWVWLCMRHLSSAKTVSFFS